MKNKFISVAVVTLLFTVATCVPAFAETMYVNANSGLNVRTGPSVSNEKVGALERGEKVEVIKTSISAEDGNEWATIVYEGKIRSACAAYLSDEEPEPEPEPSAPAATTSGNWQLWGPCTVTHYCNCSICCGQWAGGGTASGTTPVPGRTVAADLPFGTRLLINGHEYVVEDRGVGGMWVDIFVGSHSEALQRGMYTTDVYILS